MLFFFFFFFPPNESPPPSIHPDLAFRFHGFHTLSRSPFPPPFVSSKVHSVSRLSANYSPLIDRRNRSIVHLPRLSALFESHPHLDSINVRVSLREINLSYIGLTYRRQCPITKLAKHGAVTQNGLRQGWPPLFALAIFISSTCAALPADRILRISYGWNFLLILRERIEALARKQCQATGKLPLPHHAPRCAWQLAKLT